jgi:hypothetical protein
MAEPLSEDSGALREKPGHPPGAGNLLVPILFSNEPEFLDRLLPGPELECFSVSGSQGGVASGGAISQGWFHRDQPGLSPKGIVRFYNGRGTAGQCIKEGKYVLNWTRLSWHKSLANQVRLWPFVLAYNLGNFMRRLVLPEDMKHWTLTSLQTRLIKTGGRLVRHARRLVFELAEVLVTREMLARMLERISRLRLAPG